VDDDLALDKKHGRTSDRSCSGTCDVPNLVSRPNMSLMPGGMPPTVSRGDPRESADQGTR
jgi:hypothetical protein